MFRRHLIQELQGWKIDKNRKPLILRGARQTGKTTLIKMFSQEFEQFISLNLELSADRRIWDGEPNFNDLLRNIELTKNTRILPGKTLLFLDEIQNEPRAIQSLRYFYEQKPDLHVIATGSLLEVSLKQKGFSFPVGRVSFLYLHPLRFDEFLTAIQKDRIGEELNHLCFSSKISPTLHALAEEQYKEYLYVGGMPESVKIFSETKNHSSLKNFKEGLLASFEEDVPKYARPAQTHYIRFLIQHAPLFAGQRIQYANFANSGHRSREMRQAFETLEKAMILQRISGNVQTIAPMQPNLRVAPKLLFLDTGLVAHKLGVDFMTLKGTGELNDLFRGTFSEQAAGQALMAQKTLTRETPLFWYRHHPGSIAEIDYCITVRGKIIPVEVKSGKTGTLRSLLQFMEEAPHPYAVRVYSGPLQMDSILTPKQKKICLLSVPFYMVHRLEEIIENWMD
ncbi:MAG: hypothetical protein A3D92_20025 [Bacteroidetes bacterium RIFCSPHIGHO2_02_FULL_44_7]|nr:MAG: hypothetical protein A3D92_20025 [Bacteroidetes bacterium RIFCSPHIGHO2_02_FULL_44_7]